MTMSKTPNGRLSHPYIEGVNEFINFSRAIVDLSGNILCSCILLCEFLLTISSYCAYPFASSWDDAILH